MMLLVTLVAMAAGLVGKVAWDELPALFGAGAAAA
jgi:uncharacterized membrane protein YuzA (DUF378 family)